MTTCLVTGASGFVGANLARFLLKRKHNVQLILRKSDDVWRLNEILDKVRVHIADLRDFSSLRHAVSDAQADWIFHLGAFGAYSYQTDLMSIIETNFIGTINLVQVCLEFGFQAFVNTGSSSEYGYKSQAPSEDTYLEPNSYYAVSKAASSLLCGYVGRCQSAPIRTLRLYSVYGPFEEPTRLIPKLIVKGLQQDLPPLVEPQVSRDFVYIDDVCEAYLKAASKTYQEPGVIYNVGTGVQTSIRETVQLARKIMKLEIEPCWASMPNRDWDTSVWVCNNGLINDSLGWKPAHNFGDGFVKTVEWFVANPEILNRYKSWID